MTPPDATPLVSQPADRSVSVLCPPKINLTLAVGRPRPDGLHPITSLMLGLSPGFADELTIQAIDLGPSQFDLAFAEDAPVVQRVDWPIESDLAYRAHQLVEAAIGRPLPIRARLLKRIPTGSGLGGGSSDAAGMLIGLNRLFNLALTDQQLVQMATQIGSDVGFAVQVLLGRPAAWVTGTGDQIEPLLPRDTLHLLLLFPPASCPTGKVYRVYDELNGGASFDPDARPWIGDQPVLNEIKPSNDLAQAAYQVSPVMQDFARKLRTMGLEPFVTGSGSAMYLICRDAEAALQLQTRLSATKIACILAHSAIHAP